jgi:hypothetical protein
VHRQRICAEKYIEKSQKNFLTVRGTRRTFEVGDKVLVSKNTTKRKKKTLGKGYFPFSGEVVEVRSGGDYYKVRWGSSHPPTVEEGEICRKALRWDQLIPMDEGEETELVLQHIRQADSYNTREVEKELKKLRKIYRRKEGENGDLEVLCKLDGEKLLVWRRVADIGRSDQYIQFMQHFEYFEELRRQGREQEEAEDNLFEIEEFICKLNGSILVLWENWNEPTWVSVNRVSHLRMYQDWRASENYVELSESESEEDSEENGESVEEIEIAFE